MNNRLPFYFDPTIPPPNFHSTYQCTSKINNEHSIRFNLLCQKRQEFFNKIKSNFVDTKKNDFELARPPKQSSFKLSDHHDLTKQLDEIRYKLEKKEELANTLPPYQQNRTLDNEIKELRDKFQELKDKLTNKEYLKRLERTISKRKAKNKRIYLKRANKRIQEEIWQKQIQQKHAEIDKKIQEINEKKCIELEVKKSEKTVNETFKKLDDKFTDLKEMLEKLNNVRKLRAIRRRHAQDKNLYPKDYDPYEKVFENALNQMEEMLKSRRVQYENERQHLKEKFKIEGTQLSNKTEFNLIKTKECIKEIEEELKRLLFDANETVVETDTLYMEKNFYLQSKYSLPSLILIRQQWDKYLATIDDKNSSNIPIGWVYPSEPIDEYWSKYLKN